MAVLTDSVPVISIQGLQLDEYIVMEVFLRKELLKPSMLQFSMRKKQLLRNEGDISFRLANKLLGSRVRLEVKTLRRDETMESCTETLTFSGIIFGAQTQRDRVGQAAYIQVTAYSPDYLLVDNPHCASFEKMSLTDIITEAVQDYKGTLQVESTPQQTAQLPYVVQYNETTYQFLSRLAQRYGEFLFYDNDRLYFGKPPSGKEIKLYPDVDVLGFRYELNMEHPHFSHAQHDYLKYENTDADGCANAEGQLHGLTDVVFDQSKSVYKKETLQTLHSSVQEDADFSHVESSTTVEGWGAKGRMMTCKLRTNRADICIGDRLTMQEYADEEGLRQLEHEPLMAIGVDYHATIDGHFENEVTAVPAGVRYAPYGLVDLYPLCESQRARVVDNKDPEQLGRIRVQFLWQEQLPGSRITPWLRITQPHGGDDKGFYFIPEIDEEVMVAFENGNGEKPYVVGTLYHGQQHPGNQWPDSSNNVKAIRTRNGHTVEIHDEGQGGYIRIYDYQKENYILTYSTDEKLIKLESTGNIELYAANDIIMHAGHDITATADRNRTIIVGNDRETHIGHDDTEEVGVNQTISIGTDQKVSIGSNKTITIGKDYESHIKANKYIEVVEDNVLSAKNIRQDASEKMLLYSKQHDQISDDEMNIEGSKKVNIHASSVKIN